MSSAATFFDLPAPLDKKKQEFPLSELKGKVVLVVNVASKCGFTPQYEGLEKIYQQYKDKDFAIIGFPCNQFGAQEPGSDEEIQSFCQLNYGVSFPVLAKVDVNGSTSSPIYEWLKNQKSGFMGLTRIKMSAPFSAVVNHVYWNFEKFLIGKDGNVVERYSSLSKPESIAADIERLL
ncbi:Glutathione peroxidase 2 [Saitoella coloradoensis]